MVRPRFASTVVLVRPNKNGGFEVLLTRRPEEMRFLGGFYVFPGGAVHGSDYSSALLERCHGVSGDPAQLRLIEARPPAARPLAPLAERAVAGGEADAPPPPLPIRPPAVPG